MTKKWLITGGCGFIGRALISSLQQRPGPPRIRVLDNQSVGSIQDLQASCGNVREGLPDWNNALQLITGDIQSQSDVDAAVVDAEIVIHLAANTGVAPSVAAPMADCVTNVIGTVNVLEACRRNRVQRFVLASSGAPLGEQEPPLHEDLAPRPASPYGASKLAGEAYCSAYFHSFGLDTVALRFGNVYGPGSRRKSSVVAKLIREAVAGQPWEIYGDGLQTRDFIYIDDLVAAIAAAVYSPDVGGEVFQIASNAETCILDLVAMLRETLAVHGVRAGETEFGEQRAGDVRRNYSDTRKANQLLGWSAKTPLSEGLRATVDSLLVEA